MKNTKKFITVVLCMLLIISSVASVSADENTFSGIVSKTVEASENGDVELIIDIAGNPGLISLILEVSYDSDVLTLKENGFTDTGLLKGKVDTTLTVNPFRLSWQDSGATMVNNYANGTIAKLYFKMKEGFYGTTDVNVNYYKGQTLVNSVVVRPPALQSGIMTVTRNKLAIKNGEVAANSLNGETLIVASYDENGMINCKMFPNSKGNVKFSIFDVISTEGATKLKAFLWEDTETCIPACTSAEEDIAQ